ncbi:hypothetical protein JI435_044220, partial [Parastagonospora nodorum SN15]
GPTNNVVRPSLHHKPSARQLQRATSARHETSIQAQTTLGSTHLPPSLQNQSRRRPTPRPNPPPHTRTIHRLRPCRQHPLLHRHPRPPRLPSILHHRIPTPPPKNIPIPTTRISSPPHRKSTPYRLPTPYPQAPHTTAARSSTCASSCRTSRPRSAARFKRLRSGGRRRSARCGSAITPST